MSSETPKFKCGDRMQAMCTDYNRKCGIYACCGVVLKALEKPANIYYCFLEIGKFIYIDACQMCHVDEEMYQGWKKNGINTANPQLYVSQEIQMRKSIKC